MNAKLGILFVFTLVSMLALSGCGDKVSKVNTKPVETNTDEKKTEPTIVEKKVIVEKEVEKIVIKFVDGGCTREYESDYDEVQTDFADIIEAYDMTHCIYNSDTCDLTDMNNYADGLYHMRESMDGFREAYKTDGVEIQCESYAGGIISGADFISPYETYYNPYLSAVQAQTE